MVSKKMLQLCRSIKPTLWSILRQDPLTQPILSAPPASGDFSPVVYSTVLVAGPAGVPTCVNVTNYLWEGRSSFRMSITKVTAAGGIVKVGAPSSASVSIFNAGKVCVLCVMCVCVVCAHTCTGNTFSNFNILATMQCSSC